MYVVDSSIPASILVKDVYCDNPISYSYRCEPRRWSRVAGFTYNALCQRAEQQLRRQMGDEYSPGWA